MLRIDDGRRKAAVNSRHLESKMRRLLSTCHGCAFLTVLLWSSAYVFTKIALEQFTGPALGFLRCAVATAALTMVMLFRRAPRPRAVDLPWLILSGAAGFALYLLAFNKGSETLNPTTCCIIISTAPIITALIARGWFKESLTAASWAAITAAFGGVVLLMLWDGSMTLSGGVFWMLAAALLISLYNIIQRKLSGRYDSLQITAYSFLAGTVLLLWIAPQATRELREASAGYIGVAVFLGLFPSALAYPLWVKALALAPRTSTVTNYMYMTPLLALLLEYVIMAELPGAGALVGGAVILGSLVLFARKGRKI